MNSGLRLVGSAPILLAKLSVKRTVRVQQTYLRPSPVRKEHETPDGLSASRKLSLAAARSNSRVHVEAILVRDQSTKLHSACPAELTSRSLEPKAPPKRLILSLIAAFCRRDQSPAVRGKQDDWSGRWESNCIPNPQVLCLDGVAARLESNWSHVESSFLQFARI